MITKTYRVVVWLLSIAVAILGACVASLVWKCNLERLDARLAWSRIVDYDRCVKSAKKMSVSEAADMLGYVAHVGVMGKDPYLNKIVDQERVKATREIIQDLRTKTGEDLGNDAAAWVNRYQTKRP